MNIMLLDEVNFKKVNSNRGLQRQITAFLHISIQKSFVQSRHETYKNVNRIDFSFCSQKVFYSMINNAFYFVCNQKNINGNCFFTI